MDYTVSVLFSEDKIRGSSEKIKTFIKKCRNNLKTDKNLRNKFSKIKSELFCYQKGDKIAISRRIFETLGARKSYKSEFDNKFIGDQIKKMVGSDEIEESDYWDLIENRAKIKTQLGQDFTCFVTQYFFSNPFSNHYILMDDLKRKKLKITKKVSISSNLDDFDIFLYKENYLKFFDSVATAQTIIQYKTRLNIKHSLSEYVVAEEGSHIGNKIKSIPFSRIKLTENNYYTDENKLTTADIYLCNTSSNQYKEKLKVLNSKSLTHEQYKSSINFLYNSGDLIPISLKKIRTQDVVGDSFVTSRIKVMNIISESEDVQDIFLKKIMELLGIKDKSKFIIEMSKVIDIKNETLDLNPYGAQTTLNFDLMLKRNERGIPIKKDYSIYIEGNVLVIKSKDTSSASGIGKASMQFLKDQILMKLPDRGKFIRAISTARKNAFQSYYQSTQDLTKYPLNIYGSLTEMTKKDLVQLIVEFNKKYPKQKIFSNINQIKSLSNADLIQKIESIRTFKKYSRYSLLSKAAILSPSEYEEVFKNIPSNLIGDIAKVYIRNLYYQLNKVPDIDTSLIRHFTNAIYGTKEKTIYNKLSDMEIIYFLTCSRDVVKKWIKNSFIMGAYGIASAAGVILLDGKPHTLGKGHHGIVRRNPVYVKIGH